MREPVLVLAVAVALSAVLVGAWVPASSAAIASSPAVDAGPSPGPVSVAWPVTPIAPVGEGCMTPALNLMKVVAVVLGALAAIKLPLVLAKLLLAKVLVLLPLALPLALPLILPFMLIGAMMPLPGMDDSSSSPTPGPANPAPPPVSGPAGGGNASPVNPSADESEARGVWVERCIQRVACQLNTRGSSKECAKFHCAAVDWIGGS